MLTIGTTLTFRWSNFVRLNLKFVESAMEGAFNEVRIAKRWSNMCGIIWVRGTQHTSVLQQCMQPSQWSRLSPVSVPDYQFWDSQNIHNSQCCMRCWSFPSSTYWLRTENSPLNLRCSNGFTPFHRSMMGVPWRCLSNDTRQKSISTSFFFNSEMNFEWHAKS